MFAEPLSVPSTDGAGAEPSIASVETTATPDPIASTAESSAATTTPQIGEQPIESVGIQQLRTQNHSLNTDLKLYKPAYELLQQHGGLDRVQEVLPEALSIYSEIIKTDGFDTFNLATALHKQDPENFHTFAMGLPEVYPPLKEAMETQIRQEYEAKYGQSSQAAQQSDNLEYGEYDPSDPVQARLKQAEEKNRAYEERFSKIENAQKQTAQEIAQKQSDERFETLALSKLRTAFQEPLAQLKGWTPQQLEKVTRDIKAGLDENPKFADVMGQIEKAARAGAQGRLLELIPEAKKMLATQQKQSIEYFSQTFNIQQQAIQQQRATQTARREVPTNGSGASPATPNHYKSITDPNLQNDLVAEIEANMARRR